VHGAQVIGTAVPASLKGPQGQDGAAGDQRSDLRRPAMPRLFGAEAGPAGKRRRKSRSSSSATRLRDGLRIVGKQSGTREWSTQEGPRKVGRFSPRASVQGRPDGSKDQRTLGPRSLVDRFGSSHEGAVRSEATPELVSQDRERIGGPSGFSDQVTNTGISFARRSGGWQQCRPPFLYAQLSFASLRLRHSAATGARGFPYWAKRRHSIERIAAAVGRSAGKGPGAGAAFAATAIGHEIASRALGRAGWRRQ